MRASSRGYTWGSSIFRYEYRRKGYVGGESSQITNIIKIMRND